MRNKIYVSPGKPLIERLSGQRNLFFQISILFLPLVFFLDVVLIKKSVSMTRSWGLLAFTVFMNAVFLISFLAFLASCKPFLSRKIPAGRIAVHVPFIIVLLISTFLAAAQFSCLPIYDGGLYYDQLLSGVMSFNVSIASFLQSFVLWTHPTYGMALFAVPGELLLPGSSIGVYIMTLIVFLLSAVALYRLFAIWFPDASLTYRALAVGLYTFHPYVLGLITHVNPDHYSLFFFIILVWAYAENFDILAAFLSLLLIFTKETGILFVVPFLLFGELARYIGSKGKGQKKEYKTSRIRRILLFSIAPILFILYYRFWGSFSFATNQTGETPIRWDSNGIHCFGFSLPYISMRMAQTLIFNLFWIPCLFFVIFAFLYFAREKKSSKRVCISVAKSGRSSFFSIAAAYLSYFVFSLLFITLALPRYNVYFVLPCALILFFCVRYIFRGEKLRSISICIICGFFLLQNYVTVDPTLYLFSERLDLGNTTICSPTRYRDLPIVYEMYVYNRQFAYTEDLIDRFFASSDFSSHDTLVTIDDADYELMILYKDSFTTNKVYWDPDLRIRTYAHENPNAFIPDVVRLSSEKMESWNRQKLPSDFYLILLWRNADSKYVEELKSIGYTVTNQSTEENYAGKIYIYHMSR